MNTTIPDLWPADLGLKHEPPPVAILRQQGYLLGQRTRNAVIGEVHSASKPNGEFIHTLEISAPLLGFSRPIMHVRHGTEFFPAEVAFYNEDGSHRFRENVPTSEEFMTVLKRELAAPQVVRLIAVLDAQCRDFESED